MRNSNQEQHPFFCWKKRCRKTAWDTPEYLTETDWELARNMSSAKTGQEYAALVKEAFTTGRAEGLFNRILGWPEGFHYCRSDSFLHGPAWSGFQQHEQHKLQAAVDIHFNQLSRETA
jgi:hypothetical protein